MCSSIEELGTGRDIKKCFEALTVELLGVYQLSKLKQSHKNILHYKLSNSQQLGFTDIWHSDKIITEMITNLRDNFE